MRYAKLFCFQKIQYVLIEYYLSTFGVCVPDGQVKCRNPRSVGIIDPLEECLAGPGHDLLRNSAVSQTQALYTLARGLAVLESLISLLPLTFLRLVASVMTPHMSHRHSGHKSQPMFCNNYSAALTWLSPLITEISKYCTIFHLVCSSQLDKRLRPRLARQGNTKNVFCT